MNGIVSASRHTPLGRTVMDDADLGWHASQIRRVALELEDALPAGQWEGPSQLECRARIMEIRDDLHRVARLVEIAAREMSG